MTEPLARMVNIHKRFGAVLALRDVGFTVGHEEVVGLIGDNGAGKSTLIKILTGVHQPDRGEIYFEGKKVKMTSPTDAIKLGIETVYQDRALCDNVGVARNFFMGREPYRSFLFGKFLDVETMNRISMSTLKEIGLHISRAETEIKFLSGGEKQGVAMGRAIYFKPKLLVLDEPTIGLSVKETMRVLDYVSQLKKEKISSIFISHNLYHVYPIADRIVVLRRGETVGDFRKEETSVDKLTDVIIQG